MRPSVWDAHHDLFSRFFGDSKLAADAQQGDTTLQLEHNHGVFAGDTLRVSTDLEPTVASRDRYGDTVTLQSGLNDSASAGERASVVPLVRELRGSGPGDQPAGESMDPRPDRPFASIMVTNDTRVGTPWGTTPDKPKGSGFEHYVIMDKRASVSLRSYGEFATERLHSVESEYGKPPILLVARNLGVSIMDVGDTSDVGEFLSTGHESRAELDLVTSYRLISESPYPMDVIEKVKATGDVGGFQFEVTAS